MPKSVLAKHNRCKRNAIDVPKCGVLWGIYLPPQPASTGWIAPYSKIEVPIGRRFDLVKNYSQWKAGVTFPTKAEASYANRRHQILEFAWAAVDYGTRAKISYASIASGAWDKSVIRPEARALKHFHHKVFIDFSAEFDGASQTGHGTPAQYVAAYRHIHDVMKAAGVKNVIWAWVSTGDLEHASVIRASYPGPKYVNWVGYDPYNFAGCHNEGWRSPYETFSPFYKWTRHQTGMRHKPLLLGEYASAIGPKVGAWYAHVATALHHLPRIKALMQWSSATSSTCDFRLTDSAAALAGFGVSSNSRYVLGAG
ncbi:MAG TPA: glycosyl hydrolase [Mycobacteriales bacterium]|nr:glycosyl hydrolase [Mycobacteriales bacterium]